jgi:hypothetical protein
MKFTEDIQIFHVHDFKTLFSQNGVFQRLRRFFKRLLHWKALKLSGYVLCTFSCEMSENIFSKKTFFSRNHDNKHNGWPKWVSTVSMATEIFLKKFLHSYHRISSQEHTQPVLLNLNEPFLRYLFATVSIVSRFHGNSAYIPGQIWDFFFFLEFLNTYLKMVMVIFLYDAFLAIWFWG